MEKVVLAYSGGLDTSVILKWLAEEGYDVIACVIDLGQQEDLAAVRAKGEKTGAAKVYVEDVRREFVTDFVFPALKGGAVYEGRYLLGTSIGRPLIAKKQVEVAVREKAVAVSHGATGKGNDQVRLELTYAALNPVLKVIAPWKTKKFLDQFQGRDDMIAYAKKHGIDVQATAKAPYSMDANLLHVSYEAGMLEDPRCAPPRDMFRLTTDPANAPDAEEEITIEFRAGVPVRVTNTTTKTVKTDPLELFLYLNQLGGKHGIGRVDMVENRYVGIKSRGVYEAPGATILWKAHRDLEGLVLDREVSRMKDTLALKFAELIYYGYWYSPEMEMLMAAIEKSQEMMTGSVGLRLYKGNATVIGREAPISLYDPEIASMHVLGGFNQEDSKGFIQINAVRLKAYHAARQKFAKARPA